MAKIARDYAWYHSITIQESKVPSTRTDATIKLTRANFSSDFLDADGGFAPDASGKDIRFFSDSNFDNPIPFDIVRFQLDNNPLNSQVIIHVKVPSISGSVDTVIYVVWGYSLETALPASHSFGRNNAYKTGWQEVHPGVSTGTEFTDRTSNLRHGTKKAAGEPLAVTSGGNPLDYQDFDGVDDYINLPDNDPGTNFTVLFQMRTSRTVADGWERIISKKTVYTEAAGFEIARINANDTQIEFLGSSGAAFAATVATSIGDNTWKQIAGKYTGTEIKAFSAGALAGTGAVASYVANASTITLGDNAALNEAEYEGDLQDIWIYSGILDDDEIIMMQNNWNDPSTFAIPGTRTAVPSETRNPVTIKSIQTITQTLTGTLVDVTVSAVDVNKSILFSSARMDSASPVSYKSRRSLTSSTNVRIARETGAAGTLDVVGKLIEFNNGVWVEHFNAQTLGASSLSVDITLSKPFNRNRSFIILTENNAGTITGSDDRIRASFKFSDVITISRQATGAGVTFSVQVIELDNLNVQIHQFTDTSGAATLNRTLASAVNLSKTFVIGSSENAATFDYGAQDLLVAEVTTTTNLQLRRYNAAAGNSTHTVFVCEFVDDTVAYQYRKVVAAGTASTTQTLSPAITEAESIVLAQSLQQSYTGFPANLTDDDAGDTAFTLALSSDTNVNLQRAEVSGTQEADVVFAVLDFLSATTGISPSGISSGEGIGSASISVGNVNVAPTGIGSAEVIGSASLTSNVNVTPSSILSEEEIGILSITSQVVLVPEGIASGELIGNHQLIAEQFIGVASITSNEAVSNPSVLPGNVNLVPASISSSELIPTPSLVLAGVQISPTGIVSTEMFGSLTLVQGGPVLQLIGIQTEEVFGIPSIGLSVAPNSITSDEQVNSPQLIYNQPLIVLGIESGEILSSPVVTPQILPLAPTGIPSGEMIGLATILPGNVNLNPPSISSGELFGSPIVRNTWLIFVPSIELTTIVNPVMITLHPRSKLQQDFEDDLNEVFFHNDFEFGENGTYIHADGTSKILKGIFDNEYARADVDAGVGVMTSSPAFWIQSSKLNQSPNKGDRLIIRGIRFKVISDEPDGTGLTVLTLHRENQK